MLLLSGLFGCGADADAGRLYVASGSTDQVFILDARDGAILDTLRFDPRRGETDEPHGIGVAPDGGRWYVTLGHGEPTLWAVEADAERVVGRVRLPLPGAARVRITPDGARALVPDFWRSGQGRTSSVAVVDLATLTVLATLPLCAAPHDAAPSPDGSLVAVACPLSDEVLVLDARTWEVRTRSPAGSDPGPPGQPRYRPLNVAWLPDGSGFFVGMHASGEVVRFDPEGREETRLVTGGHPAQIAVTSTGALLVPDRHGGTLAVLDAAAGTPIRTLPLGAAHPHGLSVAPDGRTAWVALEGRTGEPGTVVAVDLVRGAVVWSRPLGGYLLGIAFRPPAGVR
ncbi:MAG: YncE family protein [Gemmatimonadetes bacterium]|nr:YncE family protein [Gemmatimonadota bacterium]